MVSIVTYGSGVPCAECGAGTEFKGFDEGKKVELYRCSQGHETEVPERENGKFGKS